MHSIHNKLFVSISFTISLSSVLCIWSLGCLRVASTAKAFIAVRQCLWPCVRNDCQQAMYGGTWVHKCLSSHYAFYVTIGQLLKYITALQTLRSKLKTASFFLHKVSYVTQVCVGPFYDYLLGCSNHMHKPSSILAVSVNRLDISQWMYYFGFYYCTLSNRSWLNCHTSTTWHYSVVLATWLNTNRNSRGQLIFLAWFIFSLQLEPIHTTISEFAGSAMAYKCFGRLLTTFVAGWEDYEKARAYCLVQSISRCVYQY